MNVTERVQKAFDIALKTRENSHSPYSKFKVGAAVTFKGHDKIFGGCNVENASFGGTVCAERIAIWSGIAELGKSEIDFLVVVCDTSPVTVPCAFCLQVMSEFGKADMPVYLANLSGIKKEVKFSDLLPMPFTDF